MTTTTPPPVEPSANVTTSSPVNASTSTQDMGIITTTAQSENTSMTTTTLLAGEASDNVTTSSPVNASTSTQDMGVTTTAETETISMTTSTPVAAEPSANVTTSSPVNDGILFTTTITATHTPMPTQMSQQNVSKIIDPTVEQNVKLLKNRSEQGVYIPALAYFLNIPISVRIDTNKAILDTTTYDVHKTKVADILKLGPSGSVFESPVVVSIVADRLPGVGRRLALCKLDQDTQQWQEQPNSIMNSETAVVSVETMSFSYWTVFDLEYTHPTLQPHTTPLTMLPKPASRSTDDTVYILVPAIVGFGLFCLIVVCVCYPELHCKSRILLLLGCTPRAEGLEYTPRGPFSQGPVHVYNPPISTSSSLETTLPTAPFLQHGSHNNSIVSPTYNYHSHGLHPPAAHVWRSHDNDNVHQNSMLAWRPRNT